ncbi:MAG: rhodanese-like domain-containing protein [Saprospiraceae bacterium]
MNLKEIIKKPGVTIIDVRSRLEFFLGHIKGSKNIPLGSLPNKLEDIKKLNQPIVLVCASGMRSGQALSFLKSKGLKNLYNGGSWASVKQMQQN